MVNLFDHLQYRGCGLRPLDSRGRLSLRELFVIAEMMVWSRYKKGIPKDRDAR
jgi:hypothetical protein